MKHKHSLIVSLITSLYATQAHANEPLCNDSHFCTPLTQPGKSLRNSQILTRQSGSTPPVQNTEIPMKW